MLCVKGSPRITVASKSWDNGSKSFPISFWTAWSQSKWNLDNKGYEAKIEEREKRPAAAGCRIQDTSGLSHQRSAVELQQPDNHQPSDAYGYYNISRCNVSRRYLSMVSGYLHSLMVYLCDC